MGSIPELRRSPRVGAGNLFQNSCLEDSMNRGAWWATIHDLAKSRTQLSNIMNTIIMNALNTYHKSLCRQMFSFLLDKYAGVKLQSCIIMDV